MTLHHLLFFKFDTCQLSVPNNFPSMRIVQLCWCYFLTRVKVVNDKFGKYIIRCKTWIIDLVSWKSFDVQNRSKLESQFEKKWLNLIDSRCIKDCVRVGKFAKMITSFLFLSIESLEFWVSENSIWISFSIFIPSLPH